MTALDTEGFLHVLDGRRCITFRYAQLADDLLPCHFLDPIGLDQQLIAFASHGSEGSCGPAPLPAAGLHTRSLERLAFKEATHRGQCRPSPATKFPIFCEAGRISTGVTFSDLHF